MDSETYQDTYKNYDNTTGQPFCGDTFRGDPASHLNGQFYDDDYDSYDNDQESDYSQIYNNESSEDKTTSKESSLVEDWRESMAPKVIEKPKISFVPTWKDTDIKKNPKYASSTGADDDALDITKLKRRKSKVP